MNTLEPRTPRGQESFDYDSARQALVAEGVSGDAAR